MIAVSLVMIAGVAAAGAMTACATGRIPLEEAEAFCWRALMLYLFGLMGLALEIFI